VTGSTTEHPARPSNAVAHLERGGLEVRDVLQAARVW